MYRPFEVGTAVDTTNVQIMHRESLSLINQSMKSVRFHNDIDFEKEIEKSDRRFQRRRDRAIRKKMEAKKKEEQKQELLAFLEYAMKPQNSEIRNLTGKKYMLNEVKVTSISDLVTTIDKWIGQEEVQALMFCWIAQAKKKNLYMKEQQPNHTKCEESSKSSDVFDGVEDSEPGTALKNLHSIPAVSMDSEYEKDSETTDVFRD